MGFGEETPKEEYRSVEAQEAAADDFEDFAKKCIYTNEDENPKKNDFSGEILTESGNVQPAKSEMNGEALGTVISIIVALVIFLVGACEDDSSYPDYEYEETAFSYIYDQSYEAVSETDWNLAELADESYILLCKQNEYGSATLQDNIQSEYEEKAAAFAKHYWDKNSIDEVSDYLYDTYGDYMTSSDDPLSMQLDAIFDFYGFASLDAASWYDQPYTGERIESYGDYLDYLNQFYDEQ